MILTCAIVDDEPLALGLLKTYANKTPFLELKGEYTSAVMASKGLQDNPVDLLFLDIQMPELNGLEFSHIVSPETRIIFTPAFSQYALDSYRVNALDYLLKPISEQEINESLERLRASILDEKMHGKKVVDTLRADIKKDRENINPSRRDERYII